MAVVDFTDVEVQEFELLPRGQYLVEVTSSEERAGTEFPYLNLEMTVLEGDYADRKVWDSMSYSPKALWKLKSFLLQAGYSEEDIVGSFEVDPEEFIGQEYMVIVTQKAGNDGVVRNRVTRYVKA
jgi:hypothetical protein